MMNKEIVEIAIYLIAAISVLFVVMGIQHRLEKKNKHLLK